MAISSGDSAPDFLDHAAQLRQALEVDADTFLKAAAALHIGTRKAYYLVEIDNAFHGLPVPRERLVKIGWTKLKILSSHVTTENVKELLGKAEKYPAHKLQEIVGGSGDETAKHCVLLYFTKEQYDLFEKVLKAHGATEKARGLQDKEQALINALGETLQK